MHKNNAILVAGSQRSGTTLLNLILDSHSEIYGIDEMQFQEEKLSLYLNHADYYPLVSFKLPSYSAFIDFIKRIPDVKVLWCMRDYRDVISSMLKLNLNWNNGSLPWAVHPSGALREIINCEAALKDRATAEVKKLLLAYHGMPNIHTLPSLKEKREKAVYTAALCWRLKQELLTIYDDQKVDYQIVKYEQLIKTPKESIKAILLFIGIDWSENMLQHHKLHSGISVGDTDNTRPIDGANHGKWKEILTENDLLTIDDICLKTAREFGY